MNKYLNIQVTKHMEMGWSMDDLWKLMTQTEKYCVSFYKWAQFTIRQSLTFNTLTLFILLSA